MLFIVTNDGASEFRLMGVPLASPGRDGWVELLPEDPAERLYSVTAFSGHVVTTLRRDAGLVARSYRLTDAGGVADPVDIMPSWPVGTVELGHNELFDADEVQVVEQSWIHPKSWYAVDLRSGERRLLLTQDVPAYDGGSYVEERVQATVGDVQVPVTVVRHVDTALDGSAPCLLYGYGAYEACFEPEFDAALTALLDQGVVWAHAGIRGGGEGGRRWWLDGHLAAKQNTFSDHVAVADFLADGLVDGARIVTRGLSAGGLLQGAVFSQVPDRWAGVIAEVPAVDILTTMLDPSIPLTINEWDEWGDPRKPDEYQWLAAYSPYDNLPEPGTRPDLLVTGALHDARVMVWEPAKWVAALRHTDPEWSPRCLFRVELGEGAHAGPSGRYAHLRYEAEIYAWALERFGLV
jgi:oligopeptidase B